MPVWDRASRNQAWQFRRREVVHTAYQLATESYPNPYWAASTMNTDSRGSQHEVKVSKRKTTSILRGRGPGAAS